MTITKLSSENRFGNLYRAALRQQLPVAITTTIVLLLLITGGYLTLMTGQYDYVLSASQPPEVRARVLLELFSNGVHIRMGYWGCAIAVVGMATFASTLLAYSYMHSKKRVDLYHALPVTRDQLLGANALAVATVVLGPYLLTYLMTMVIQLIPYARYGCFGSAWAAAVAMDLLIVVTYVLVILALTGFVCVQTGTVADSFMLTCALGLIPVTLYLATGITWESETYGAVWIQEDLLRILSPFFFPLERINMTSYTGRTRMRVVDMGPLTVRMLIWMALGIALLALTFYLYRRRKSELAGQTQPGGLWQTVVKACAAYVGGFILFMVLYQTPLPLKLAGMLAGGTAIGVIVELILSRSTVNIRKNLRWLLCGSGLSCVVLLAIVLDLPGYETRVPSEGQVQSVMVSYNGRFEDLTGEFSYYWNRYNSGDQGDLLPLRTPESVGAVLSMHQAAVENRPPSGQMLFEEDYAHAGVWISYRLENGKTMSRYYAQVSTDAYLMLAQLEDREDFIRSRHPIFWMDNMESLQQQQMIRNITVYDAWGYDSVQLRLNSDRQRELIQAIQEDMLSESLEEIHNPSRPALGSLKIDYYPVWEMPSEWYDMEMEFLEQRQWSENSYVSLTEEYVHTRKLLTEWGYDELLIPREPDSICLVAPQNMYSGSLNRVNVALPNLTQERVADFIVQWKREDHTIKYSHYDPVNHETLYYDLEVFETYSPDEIRQISASAYSQMIPESHRDYVSAVAMFDGEPAGYRYILIDDLPDNLQPRVREYVESGWELSRLYNY